MLEDAPHAVTAAASLVAVAVAVCAVLAGAARLPRSPIGPLTWTRRGRGGGGGAQAPPAKRRASAASEAQAHPPALPDDALQENLRLWRPLGAAVALPTEAQRRAAAVVVRICETCWTRRRGPNGW
jgi:hypothetical protein